jgi:RNA polymerase sigma-70 factor, ECF subfamily
VSVPGRPAPGIGHLALSSECMGRCGSSRRGAKFDGIRRACGSGTIAALIRAMTPPLDRERPTPDRGETARLIPRILEGDGEAARALYDAHYPGVYRLALRLTGDGELAAECVQQAFFRAFLRLETFRGEAAFGTWLYRVAVNVALTELKKLRRTREREEGLDPDVVEGPHPPDRDPMLARRIRRALTALPDGYRVVVVMHDIQGLTHAEIGAVLGIATGTSKARLSYARARLRTLLAQCALEYAA